MRHTRNFGARIVAIAVGVAVLSTAPVFAQEPAVNLAAIRAQAAALERQWQPRGAQAREYFQNARGLLAKSKAATTNETRAASFRQGIRIAGDALTKNVALVTDVDRGRLYQAQAM